MFTKRFKTMKDREGGNLQCTLGTLRAPTFVGHGSDTRGGETPSHSAPSVTCLSHVGRSMAGTRPQRCATGGSSGGESKVGRKRQGGANG